MTPPEEAVVYVLFSGEIFPAFKKRVEFEPGVVHYYCFPLEEGAFPTAWFTKGFDAFESELEAIQALRKHIAQAMGAMIEQGQRLIDWEKSLTGRLDKTE